MTIKAEMPAKKQKIERKRARKIFFTDLGITVAVFLLFLPFLYGLINSLTFQFYGGITNRVKTNEKVVALTFDDGPLPGKTEKVLQALERQDIKATFFLNGDMIEKHTAQARKIVEAGHEIGNHGYSHEALIFKPASFIKDDIEKTDRLLESVGYYEKTIYRPAFGDKLFLLPKYLHETGRHTIMWNIAPDDEPEVASDAKHIVQHVNEHIVPGSIIILHPMYDHRKPSLDAIEPIAVSLKQQGYRFVTVSELLTYKK